jgi:hypothetical protein
MYSKTLKLKTSEFPVLVLVECSNGYIDYLEMKLPKSGIGAFLNRISKPLRHLIAGRI